MDRSNSAGEEVLGVVGQADVGPEPGPVVVAEVAGALVDPVGQSAIGVSLITGLDLRDVVVIGLGSDLGVEVVAACEVVGLEIEEGRRA
jgi:hypothetical protein